MSQVIAEIRVREGDDRRRMCRMLVICVHNKEKMAETGVENRDDKRKLLFCFFLTNEFAFVMKNITFEQWSVKVSWSFSMIFA